MDISSLNVIIAIYNTQTSKTLLELDLEMTTTKDNDLQLSQLSQNGFLDFFYHLHDVKL